MAKNAKKAQEWEQIADGVSVKGTGERFSLSWFGATIHGCRIVDGKNGAFIGWPSFKGRDGNYIKTAYIYDGDDAPEEDRKLLRAVVKHFA